MQTIQNTGEDRLVLIDNSQSLSEKDIINRISRLVRLPDGDIKSLQKVTDPIALESQSDIYKGIKKGNYVLRYSNFVVIYDAKANQVLKAGSITLK